MDSFRSWIAAHPNTSLRFALTGSPISCSYVCDPGAAVLLQVQVGQLLGKSGVCLWMHPGSRSCDDHAYQGCVTWSASKCQYRLENRGLLLELTPEIEFPSLAGLLERLDREIQTILGVSA